MGEWGQPERRRYIRIEKHFIISYYEKDDPATRHGISQLKNISMGGICFVTSQQYFKGIKLGIELKTPFLADTVHIEGTVLESHEKVANMIYETRLAFAPLNPQAEIVLQKMVVTFSKLS